MQRSMNRRRFLKNSVAAATLLGLPSMPSLASRGAMSFDEYRSRDGLALAQLVRKGEVTAAEVLEMAILRAQAVNPAINAIVEQLYDRARAAVKQPLPKGPFTGVPFLLKDLGMALEGTVTTQGSRFYKDYVADYTSTLVNRYEQAGLVIMGKSASPEFGGTATTESMLFGDTRNPWNLAHSAGGSSGGSAAAVAAGILPLANASDGGGSIRIPASCCGLFGLKPSRGRTPHGPRVLSSDMSVLHAVTRSVRDSAALLDATRGPEPGQTLIAPAPETAYLQAVQRPPGSLRIGVLTRPVTQTPVHAACEEAVNRTALLCKDLGHEIESVTLPVDPRDFFSATGTVMGVGNVLRVQNRERQLGRVVTESDLEPLTWHYYQRNKGITGEQLARARTVLEATARILARVHETYDVLLSPTMAVPPPLLGKMSLNQPVADFEREAVHASAFTMLYNATGQPAMSVPLHWTEDGLPVGVMFAAPYGDETTLFRLAGQLETAAPWFDRVPALDSAG
ncbi:MAG: amidase family protein [Halieaceae bacterium]|nr:amidase family protein [Halieaceae bacterium]